VTDYRNAWITGYRCVACWTFLSEPHFRAGRQWHDAGTDKISEPIPLFITYYVQFGMDSTVTPNPTRSQFQLYRSDSLDSAWTSTLQIDKRVNGTVKVSGTERPWLTYGVSSGSSNPDGSERIELRSVSGAALPPDSRACSTPRVG